MPAPLHPAIRPQPRRRRASTSAQGCVQRRGAAALRSQTAPEADKCPTPSPLVPAPAELARGEMALDTYRPQERFASVMLPHLDAAHNLARWLMRDADAAEDVLQDAMVRALTYFPSFKGSN